jgi:hypothetical protein
MSVAASWAQNFLESSRTVWVISAVILCLFAITNLPWQLDDYDQAQQAFTSFEMIKEGHWFFQRRAVNKQAIRHNWHFEVISGRGGGYEGMLLYLQKSHFIKPDEAVQEWNGGALDALIVPKDEISELIRELQSCYRAISVS